MKKIKKFGELNENDINKIPKDIPKIESTYKEINNTNEQPSIEKTYTESEVLNMLIDLLSETIYSYDDYSRGFEFANKQAEILAKNYLDNYNK